VRDVARISSLTLELLRDDGAAVYLNGQEIARDRLAVGAGHGDLATGNPVEGNEESRFTTFQLNSDILLLGKNLLAVEAHQQAINSDDLSFDLRLWSHTDRAHIVLPPVPDLEQYQVTLSAGEMIDVVVAAEMDSLDLSSAQLQLLDAAGVTVLAETTARSGDDRDRNYDLGIHAFQVPSDGTYAVRLLTAADVAGRYSLVVNRRWAFEREPNDAAANPVRSLDGLRGVSGALVSDANAVADVAGDIPVGGERDDIAEFAASVDRGELIIDVRFHNPIG
jgi:hypothetical protein